MGAKAPAQPSDIIDELGISVEMSEGTEVSVRIYLPKGGGSFPTLFAASPSMAILVRCRVSLHRFSRASCVPHERIEHPKTVA